MSNVRTVTDPSTNPDYVNKEKAQWEQTREILGLDTGYIARIAGHEVFRDLFIGANHEMLVIATANELARVLFPAEFRAVNDASEIYTVVGTMTFFDNVDESLMARKDWPVYLMAHLVVFVACTEGSADPKSVIDAIASQLPVSTKRQALIQQFEFDNQKTDWTQFLIDTYHAKKAAENPTLAAAAEEGFDTNFCQEVKVPATPAADEDSLGLKKKLLN